MVDYCLNAATIRLLARFGQFIWEPMIGIRELQSKSGMWIAVKPRTNSADTIVTRPRPDTRWLCRLMQLKTSVLPCLHGICNEAHRDCR